MRLWAVWFLVLLRTGAGEDVVSVGAPSEVYTAEPVRRHASFCSVHTKKKYIVCGSFFYFLVVPPPSRVVDRLHCWSTLLVLGAFANGASGGRGRHCGVEAGTWRSGSAAVCDAGNFCTTF